MILVFLCYLHFRFHYHLIRLLSSTHWIVSLILLHYDLLNWQLMMEVAVNLLVLVSHDKHLGVMFVQVVNES